MASFLPEPAPQRGAQEEDVDDLIPSSTTKPALPDYKTAFIESCISASVLTFGTYTLKSGRESPC